MLGAGGGRVAGAGGLRAEQSVGHMQSGLVAGAANGHSQMITCLDGVGGVGGGLLLSGGLDPRLFVWDLRSLAPMI